MLKEVTRWDGNSKEKSSGSRCEMACRKVASRFELNSRCDCAADILRKCAAVREHAACDALLEARHDPADLRELGGLAVQRRAKSGQGAEQALRIGMAGRAEKLGDRRLLHLATGIHDQH